MRLPAFRLPAIQQVASSPYDPKIVGSMPIGFGSGAAAYTTFRQAVTVSVHYLPRACTDLSIVYTGMLRNATYPHETPFNDFELAGSVTVITGKTNLTELSPRHLLRFQTKRICSVKSGLRYESDPITRIFNAGTWIMVLTWTNRYQSNAATVFGETGTLAATSANWPQQLYVGGALNSTILGSEIETTNTVNTTLAAKVDSGSPTIQSGNGFGPAAIRGRFLDSSQIRPVLVFGDSISMGSNDIARSADEFSGKGYVMRKLGHDFPVYQASNSGLAVQYLVGNYFDNWKIRLRDAAACEAAYVSLGTNDGATGQTAQQIKDNLSFFCDALRSKLRMQRIILGTQLCRNTSTDGLQTTGNQTEAAAGFNAKMDDVNSAITSGVIPADGYFDTRLVLQTGVNSQKWKLSTVISNQTASGGTTTVPTIQGTLTAGANVGQCALIGTESRLISANTTNSYTVGTAYTGAPANGTPITFLDQVCDDGVHPTPNGHALLAAAFPASYFLF